MRHRRIRSSTNELAEYYKRQRDGERRTVVRLEGEIKLLKQRLDSPPISTERSGT